MNPKEYPEEGKDSLADEPPRRRLVDRDFEDLNKFKGLGEDPAYHAPVLKDRPRFWPLDQWKAAPRDLGYDDLPSVGWKGLRLLKDPDTQAAYHNILWELKPKTIVEVGVYGGGSLVWFRDLANSFGFPCQVIGIDINLARCQIPKSQMENISLHERDCTFPESFSFLKSAEHPILLIDDAHCNTFNVLKYAVNNFLRKGDYVILEDMVEIWKRYSPNLLQSHLAAFTDVLAMDLVYSNAPGQLKDGVFKVLV